MIAQEARRGTEIQPPLHLLNCIRQEGAPFSNPHKAFYELVILGLLILDWRGGGEEGRETGGNQPEKKKIFLVSGSSKAESSLEGSAGHVFLIRKGPCTLRSWSSENRQYFLGT